MSIKDLKPIHYTKGLVEDIGLFSTFVLDSTRWGFRRPYRYAELINHIEFIGNKSVLIITLTGAFTGMVFSFQVYQGFKIVNAQNLVGPTVALGITRELGPVLVGLIVAARAGGAMAARIGSMRVTEQIDALEVMGVNPKQYLVAPRILAALISAPLLTALFIYVALIGAHFVSVRLLGLDEAIFLHKVYLFLEPKDIAQGLIKGTVFGYIFATVCTYKGFYTKGGARGVGDATNEGVVLSMVLIIVIDYFLTNFAVMAYRFWK